MEVRFNQIHDIVLEALSFEEYQLNFLNVIGKWYFNFLSSNNKKLTLHIPKYKEEIINVIYDYTRLFSLTYRLINKQELTDFDSTCLFNVFDYNKKKNNFYDSDSTFDFVRQEGNFLIWSNNIVVSKKRFIPIFQKKQIENSNWIDIYNTFKLFRIIERGNLINRPILINFEEDLCLSLSTGEHTKTDEIVLFNTINWDSNKMTDDDAIEYEDDLRNQDFSHQITIRYPYHKNIHSYLFNIGRQCFDLIFNSRFYYQNISEDDIILLPTELFQEEVIVNNFSSKFTIIDTSHSLELFNALSGFKELWQEYEFNKYTTPFPKYFFLFINHSLSKDEWLEIFISDYPDVAEKPIINNIIKIIDLIHELDWSKQFISQTKEFVLLLPEIRGLRKKRLYKALNSFKNYLFNNNTNVVFVENNEDFDYKEYKNLLLLDGFNIINLVNILQQNEDCKILIPDFIYYSYQPWLKYHLLNYHFEPLLNSKRESLDEGFIENNQKFSREKDKMIKNIKSGIVEYREKYIMEEYDVEREEKLIDSEDIIPRNDEELEIGATFSEKVNDKELLIVTTKNITYRLRGSNEVLLQKNYVRSCRASKLKVKDSFISMTEIRNAIDKDTIVNKLSKLPNSVVNFQLELSKSTGIYKILEKLGLEYKNEKYFNEKYVLKEEVCTREKFILPKRKRHWKIICEYLGISSNDMLQAWISHYGRKHINEIKELYKFIFNFCIENNYLGEIENPKLITEIAEYLETKKNVFENEDEVNTLELAKSITSSIINELSFHEIKEINIV